MIDRDMTTTKLRKDACISTGAHAKLGKNKNVHTEILAKPYNTLHCAISDITKLTGKGGAQ